MTLSQRSFKLGRLPRTHDPRIPMLFSLQGKAGLTPPTPPPAVNYTHGMPANLGMMLNDTLGDCTCAAVYHALQVWTFNTQGAGKMDTEADSNVKLLYEKACGYKPSQGGEGPGGNEQHVLTYLLKNGAPVGAGGHSHHKISAFVEVPVTSIDSVKNTIADCGVAYIGFNVPAYLMPPNAPPPAVWDVEPAADNSSVGGHAVILAGYDANGATVISWGQYYTMTWAFFSKFTEEAYAIADKDWLTSQGKTLGGLTLAQLEAAMQSLKQ